MPHPIDIHVGKRLRMRRTILGMSQENLGTAIGVTFQQIQKYERGVNRIGSSRLYEFSKLMTVPVSYFFDEMDKNAPAMTAGVAESASAFEHEKAPTEQDKMSSRETLEMMRSFYRISDTRIRKRVIDLIKALANEKAVE